MLSIVNTYSSFPAESEAKHDTVVSEGTLNEVPDVALQTIPTLPSIKSSAVGSVQLTATLVPEKNEKILMICYKV